MKTSQKIQTYVWRWYLHDGENWVGPYRSERVVVGRARSFFTEEELIKNPDYCVVEIEMCKHHSADLSVAVNDDFVDKTLRSFITNVASEAGDPEEVELEQFCTERQKHDLKKRLKATVKSWQSAHGIAVPVGMPIETKNNYFVHPRRKKASQSEVTP